MTSYQKLKQENDRLKREIYTLVRESDSIKGITLKMKYDIQFRLTDSIWQGSSSTGTMFNGILNMIK